MAFVNHISKIINPIPTSKVKGSSVSISQKLFTELGLVHFDRGMGALMPFLLKSLRKLEVMIHKEMKKVSALEFMLPVLIHSDIFQTSGRLELPDLYKLNINKEKSFILSPTSEEAVTHMLKLYKPINYNNLPIRFYQISRKFRDERRPRSGLLRSNEFLMKDLYCFDIDEESCEQCYQEVINQYHNFFNLLNIPYICAEGSTGDIGGLKSHEFHFLSECGQDKVILCNNCGHNENCEIAENDLEKCRKCQSTDIKINNGIEVGHCFKLGTKFTKPFDVTYKCKDGSSEFLQMSSFGIGLTRLLAASVEVLSKSEEIRWPDVLAPYLVCVLPPKRGSKEEAAAKDIPQQIYHNLNQLLDDDIIMDDRTSQTIGKRISNIKKLGIPLQVAVGKSILNDPPTVEVIDLKTDSVDYIQVPDVNQFILDKLQNNKNQKLKEKLTI